MGNKWGFHSGVGTMKDCKVKGDLYVQDDIVFSDVSAGTLGVTGGIDMQSTISAIGIDMGGTFSTTAINIDGSGGKAITVGTLSSTVPGSGIKVDATVTRIVEVHADDYDTARATGTQGRAIFGRLMIYKDNACEDWGIHGLSKVSAVAKTGNISAGIAGAFESTGVCSTATGSGNTYCAGIMGRVGTAGTFTIGSGTYVACVLAFGNNQNASAFTNTGYHAFHACLTDVGTPEVFDVGLCIEDGAATTGISIGSATTGINIEGTVGLGLGIGSTTPLTTATTATTAVKVQSDFTGTASTYHFGGYFNSAYTSTGTGSLRALVGQVDYSGAQATVTTPAQYLVGIHGRAKVTGTLDSTVICLTGVHAQILNGGTFTHANQVAALWVDWQNASTMSGVTTTALAILSNNAGGGVGPTNVIYAYAPDVTNLLNLVGATNGGMVAANSGTGAAADGVIIKIVVDGTTLYLKAASAWS